MKTPNYILLFIALLLRIITLAQYTPDKKEMIETMKVSFISKQLNLNVDEAKLFWPVYNQYEIELETVRNSRKKETEIAIEDFANLTDKAIEKMIDAQFIFKQNELDIMKKYNARFKQVLPIKKTAMLYKAEEDFKRLLLRKMQSK